MQTNDELGITSRLSKLAKKRKSFLNGVEVRLYSMRRKEIESCMR